LHLRIVANGNNFEISFACFVKKSKLKKVHLKTLQSYKKMAKVVVAPEKKAVSTPKAKVAIPKKAKEVITPKINVVKKPEPLKEVHSVLVTLPKPETEKSPYFEIAKKYGILIEFFPFVKVEGISGRDFKKQKLDISEHTAIIFTSRNAVEHFFRICEETKTKISQDMKYFCTSEAIALYLQKYILYRKRKVFYSADGTTDGLLEVIAKHKHKEQYILPTADNGKSEIHLFLEKNKFTFSEATLYHTVSNDITVLMKKKYDLLLFFSSLSIQTLFDYFPKFKQGDTIIGSFGTPTAKAILEAKLRLDMSAPAPGAPSMAAALDIFLEKNKKNKK
jgi:uroporphyrinogen-III synthase